jgi:hypothetical protein
MTTALSTTVTDSLKAEVSPIKVNAQALVITTQQHVEAARDFVRIIKERRGKVDATFDVHIKAAHQAHKALVATKKSFTDDLDEAEKIIKSKMGFYQLEQERLARIEQEKARIKAEEEQRKIVEAAQKKIAATLSKAGTVAEKVETLEHALEHDCLNETERGLIERQLEVLRLQLQGLEDKAAEAQRMAEEAAEAPTYISPAAVVEKTAGVSGKKVYIVAVTEPMVLIKAIAEGKGSAGLVKAWDETMIKKLALLGIFLPGVEYKENRAIVVR